MAWKETDPNEPKIKIKKTKNKMSCQVEGCTNTYKYVFVCPENDKIKVCEFHMPEYRDKYTWTRVKS